MINHVKKLALIGCFVLSTAHAATVLTPNSNQKSGQLPNGHTELTFKVSDANFAEILKFPTRPKANDIVHFESTSNKEVYIEMDGATDVPGLIYLPLDKNRRVHFKYNANKTMWEMFSQKQLPTNGAEQTTVKMIAGEATSYFAVENGRWTKKIKLPDTAPASQYAIIESKADWATTIVAADKNYPLKKGEKHWFHFHSEWVYVDPEYDY